MASPEITQSIKDKIKLALSYKEKNIILRGDWGAINLEGASASAEKAWGMCETLKSLPIEHLPDGVADSVDEVLAKLNATMEGMDQFNIEQSNHMQVRDQLVSTAKQSVENFYSVVAAWVPFLAYQQGDVTKNIAALQKAIDDGNELIRGAETYATEKKSEVDTIVTAAREASAAAGAAVFTKDFRDEALEHEKSARRWLRVMGLLGSGTLAAALVVLYFTEPGLDTNELIQRLGTKIFSLAIMLTATLWCGRMYKTKMHLATINGLRANGLQTFQAFSQAASDNHTKDAVLMETTRSIFANSPTGYLDQKGATQLPASKVVEIAKNFGGETGG